MEILITDVGAKTLGKRLDQIANITPVLFQKDGTMIRDGKPVTRDEIQPQGAWLSMDVLMSRRVFDYVDLLLNTPSLQWVQSTAAGFDHPLFAELAKKGLRLTNSDAQAVAISEFVLGSVLAEFQRVSERAALQAERKWEGLPFRELSNTRWMIVGMGNIGNETAKRAQAFGAYILGVKRTGSSPHADETIRPADMTGRLGECDIVVFASPLTDQTRHMGNAAYFAAMKEGATFINIGRGGLVDEQALIRALDKGTPATAILDVFETEPLPEESALWTHPRVRITPHASSRSDGTPIRGQELFLENLAAFSRNAPLRNEVSADDIIGSD